MSIDAHVDAWVALLNAGGAHAYDPGDLAEMASKPDYYTEVHVAGGPTENARTGGQGSVSPYRLILRCVGNSKWNAQREADKAAEAINDKQVTVAGVETTRAGRETFDEPVAPDGPTSPGMWSGVSSWAYAH